MEIFRLDNKNVIVTGGGSGIGRAITLLFAQQGAHVFVLELNQDAAQTVVDEVKNAGGKATVVSCNVADHDAVKKTIEAITTLSGAIDVLINNAGVAHIGTLETTSSEDFDRIFQVNVKGAYNMMHAVIAGMKANKRGVILNMASVAASVGIPDRFAYSMSKGAMLTMTLSVARDFKDDNIRCNCISPARIHTPFVDGFLQKNYPGREEEMFDKLSKSQPIGRMGSPEEVASLALYLCSDQAAFITGCDYPCDGGFIKLNT